MSTPNIPMPGPARMDGARPTSDSETPSALDDLLAEQRRTNALLAALLRHADMSDAVVNRAL